MVTIGNPPVPLQLTQLVSLEAFQPRVEGLFDDRHVRQLEQSDIESWPPLSVVPLSDGSGKYGVLDGHNRFEAAQRLKLKQIVCEILPAGAGVSEAFACNASHGLPYSLATRKDHARRLHKEHPDWSLREIGRRCGLSHHTVETALEETGQNAQSQTRNSSSSKSAGERVISLLLRLDSEDHVVPDPEDVADDLYSHMDETEVATLIRTWGTMLYHGAEIVLSESDDA